LKIKTDQEIEFDVLSMGECMNQLSRSGHQRIELIPMFEVYAGGGEYNVACYGMHANFSARLKNTVKRPFRLELLLTNQFFDLLGGKSFVRYICNTCFLYVLAFMYALL
jgi:hypothetical protein